MVIIMSQFYKKHFKEKTVRSMIFIGQFTLMGANNAKVLECSTPEFKQVPQLKK